MFCVEFSGVFLCHAVVGVHNTTVAIRLCILPRYAGAKTLGLVNVERVTVLYVAHLVNSLLCRLVDWLAVFVNQIVNENAVNLLFYVAVAFYLLFSCARRRVNYLIALNTCAMP